MRRYLYTPRHLDPDGSAATKDDYIGRHRDDLYSAAIRGIIKSATGGGPEDQEAGSDERA